jgi:hypothetical protein
MPLLTKKQTVSDPAVSGQQKPAKPAGLAGEGTTSAIS